jgi:hypothetical protein
MTIGDPFYKQVVTLLHFNDVNGANTFVDNANLPLVWAPSGGAVISDAVAKWGIGSLDMGTANTRVIFTPNQASMALTNLDYCFECWVYITDLSRPGIIVAKSDNSGNSPAFTIRTFTDGVNMQFGPGTYSAPGVPGIGLAGSGPFVVAGRWYHLALYRKITAPGVSATEYFAVDGVINVATGTPGSWRSNDTTDHLVIGNYLAPNLFSFTGYIDDVRLTVGNSRYLAGNIGDAFAVPKAEFPNGPPIVTGRVIPGVSNFSRQLKV